MNNLEREIRALIETQGPLEVSRYMALCLSHPKYGYYTTRDPFGMSGDFTTAPEISQMFGELIGVWCAEVWRLMGSPSRVALVEAGPGRGTLMKDALRAAQVMPGFLNAAELHFVETSPVLQEKQRETLHGAVPSIAWHGETNTLPDAPLIVIGNEFVDALPIGQFEKKAGRWHERKIGLGADGGFAFGLDPAPLPDFEKQMPERLTPAPNGAVFEQRDLTPISEIVSRIGKCGGAALFIDYGHAESGFGDTLQAVSGHDYAEPLEAPGEADLTSQVDFEALAALANKRVRAIGPFTQRDFLTQLGIEVRAEILQRNAKDEMRDEIGTALTRLIGPAPGMGELFKAIAFAHRDLPRLPGFDGAKISGDA
ncbi:MAG: SAM-dependent methyltransferase [Xanthobacteraceae bacterium]|nr:SAM-dependent methyltransferase [Xanthobacteraceae bacterium]